MLACGVFGWSSGLWGCGSRIAVAALIVGGAVLYFYAQLPPVGALLDGRARGSVTMLDRDGDVFAWRGEQFGGQITADTVAPALRNAIVATEDRRFFATSASTRCGIAGAIRINLREGRGPLEGTRRLHHHPAGRQAPLPRQCPTTRTRHVRSRVRGRLPRATIARKLKEAPIAMAMELKYSKDEILTIYLNRAYLGAGARGFEAAAQRYFGKSAANVDAGRGGDARGASHGTVALRARPTTSSARRTAQPSSSA